MDSGLRRSDGKGSELHVVVAAGTDPSLQRKLESRTDVRAGLQLPLE